MSISRLPSGRYRARYLNPHAKYTREGRRNYVNAPATFRTKAEAQAWLTGQQADISAGRWKSPEQLEAERIAAEIKAATQSVTFGDYSTDWMQARRLTKQTRRSYTSHLDTHLLPRWKDVPLKAITTPTIRAWLAEMAPGAPMSRRRSYELFRTILGTAVEDDLLDTNPCKRNMLTTIAPASAPRKQKKHIVRVLTPEELTALANEVVPYMRTAVLLSGTVGLRSGEVRALTGKSLEVHSDGIAWLHITQAVTGAGKTLVVSTPKTSGSVRVVPVPPSLKNEVVALAANAGPDGFLFHSPKRDAQTVIPDSTWRENIQSAALRAGIGKFVAHDLRRTAASRAVADGAAPTEVRDLLGHTTVTMTDKYTKSSPSQLARIVEAADRARISPEPNIIDLTKRKAWTA